MVLRGQAYRYVLRLLDDQQQDSSQDAVLPDYATIARRARSRGLWLMSRRSADGDLRY